MDDVTGKPRVGPRKIASSIEKKNSYFLPVKRRTFFKIKKERDKGIWTSKDCIKAAPVSGRPFYYVGFPRYPYLNSE